MRVNSHNIAAFKYKSSAAQTPSRRPDTDGPKGSG